MKNTKTALRILLCFALMLVVVLSMASCDIGGAFGQIADGNFKGAMCSLTGKHEYTTVVTEPTCLARGYTTYTCGKCGGVYVDDYVDPTHALVSYEGQAPTCTQEGCEPYESCTNCSYTTYKAIPKSDHDYVEKVTRFPTPYSTGIKSKICTVCGSHEDVSIEAVSFNLPDVAEMLKSYVGANVIEISAKDSEIIIIKEFVGGESTYDKNALAIRVAYLKVDGVSDEFYAHLSLDLGLLTYDSLADDAVPTFENQLVVDLIVNGDEVYLALTEDGEKSENEAELNEVFYTALASCLGMSYDEYVESVYVAQKVTECLPFVQEIVQTIVTLGSEEINPILPTILSFIGENVIVVEGNKYTFDVAGFAEVLAALEGKTVADIVDSRYGKGTFARVESFLVSLPGMKMKDIANLAVEFSEKSEVSIDDVYSIINYIIYSATGKDFNIESEIITRYDMTLVAVLMESGNYTADEIAEQTAELAEQIATVLNTVKGLDVDQIYNYLVYGNPDYSVDGTGNAFRITESLASYIEAIGESVKLEAVLNDDGSLGSFKASVEGAFAFIVVNGADGYSVYFTRTEYEYNENYVYEFSCNASAEKVTVSYTMNGEDLLRLDAVINELGEIVSLDVSYSQVVTISSWIPDNSEAPENSANPGDLGIIDGLEGAEGDGYYEDSDNPGYDYGYVLDSYREIEWIADIQYRNENGKISAVIESDVNTVTVEADVVDVDGGKLVTGSFSTEYSVENGGISGSFSYAKNSDGIITDATLKISETRCDYTNVISDEENNTVDRVYDSENPKTFDVFELNYTYDGDLSLTLDVNTVSNNDGSFDVKNYFEINAAVTTTEKDDGSYETVLDVTVDSWDVYGVKFTVSYDKIESEGEESVYTEVIDGAKLEMLLNGELQFVIEVTATETEDGRYFSFNAEGLKYIYYDTVLTPGGDEGNNGMGGSGYCEPVDYDGSEVTIVFYHTMGYSLREVLDEYIAEFNRMYPNITVVHEYLGDYDGVRDQIKTEITVGNQPNIAYCYPDHVAIYNTAGVVVPLDEFINNESFGFTEEELENFIDGFYAEGGMYDDAGTMYSLPFMRSTEVLYYNKTFFEAHNLKVPTTWDEMEAVCEYIKSVDPDSIPLGYDSEANWFINMCAQYGSPYTSLDDHYLFNNDTNRAFVARFREWYQNGWVATQEIYGSYMSEPFKSGTTYMVIGSTAGASYNYSESFEVGISAMVQVDPSNPKVISQGPSLCMFKQNNPQEVAATWLFMKFLTANPELQAAFSVASGYTPVVESVYEIPAYKEFLNSGSSENRGTFVALANRVALEQMDAYFASPAFNGSAKAREEVGYLMLRCFLEVTDDVDATIQKFFEEAVEECLWYEY